MDGNAPAAVKAAIEAFNGLLKIRDWSLNAEERLKVANAQSALYQVEVALLEALRENDQLKIEIKEIKQRKSEIKSLKRVGELFFDDKNRLYKCTRCIEKDGIVLTLANQNEGFMRMKCATCQTEYVNPNYRSRDWSRNTINSDFDVI